VRKGCVVIEIHHGAQAMTPHEIRSAVTPITYPGVINALLLAWEQTGTQPAKEVVYLASAQVGIETGMGSCRSYNISGIKTKPGSKTYCWQYFTTREIFSPAQVTAAQQLGSVTVLGPKGKGIEVTLNAPHPWGCFRAFETLQDAALDHLLTLRDKFPSGWAGLLTGDPDHFAHGLRANGYYTALESEYAAGLRYRLKEAKIKCPPTDLVWGDVI
jgi:hypothetical protein